MYWYSEKSKTTAIDWRPEIHDSDGLAMWTGTGERIWRPLNNPPRIITSAFADENPRGFGLLQRDRIFDHYLDGVYYDRRPSLWVEPLGDWGRGSIQLVEIPTDDEIHDNIVAMWVPAEPAARRQAFELRYRLHWAADEPYPTPLARVRRDPPRQRRPGRHRAAEGRAQVHGRVPRRAPDQAAVRRHPRARCSPPRAASSPTSSPRPCPTTCRATGGPSSTSRSTGTEPVEMRCYLRNGERGPERDLALPVPPDDLRRPRADTPKDTYKIRCTPLEIRRTGLCTRPCRMAITTIITDPRAPGRGRRPDLLAPAPLGRAASWRARCRSWRACGSWSFWSWGEA